MNSFIYDKTDASGQSSGSNTQRGYGILLEDVKNYETYQGLDFYTFNFLENLFDFPIEILSEGSNGDDCGPVFFADGFIKTCKIKFQYKILSKSES